ncbi:MAG TPA: cation:proton antiporter [Candidatus Norongarragalinales archaeon]|jgi:CPA2 family monovalent cation:H+ antiporter-2|nr:cation:proton antiporter [Candidatus Norongarragalinales archaeon]
MAAEFNAIIEIGVVIIVGLVFGIVFSRIKLSSTLGYLLAGLVLGPIGFSLLVPGQGVADVFGLIGMLMLLFYLGLEMNLPKLRETGAIAIIFSIAEMAAVAIGGFIVGKIFGLPDVAAGLLGALLISTSTVEAVEFILSRGLLQTLEAKVALSALIVEDFAAILLIVLISSIANQQGVFTTQTLDVLLFVVAMFYIVRKISSPLLSFLGRVGHADKMTIFGIGVGLFVSFLGASIGLPVVIGAYFAGFALAETAYGETIKRELRFFREFFVLFFFVAFGASVFYDATLHAVVLPSGAEWFTILGITALLLLFYLAAKVLSFGIVGTALGLNATSAISIGMMMFAIGEFSILIAQAARPLVGRAVDLVSLAFLLTIVTLVASPFLFNRSRELGALFTRVYPERVRRALSVVGQEARSIEHFASNQLAENVFVRASQELFSNLLIAISIIYISLIVPYTVGPLPVSLLVLPLLLLPLYRAARELGIIFSTLGSNRSFRTGERASSGGVLFLKGKEEKAAGGGLTRVKPLSPGEGLARYLKRK